MSTFLVPGPLLPSTASETTRVLRELWVNSRCVDAALANPSPILEILGLDTTCDSARLVRMISAHKRPEGWPLEWVWKTVVHGPAPEFLLFYGAAASFPECALIFTGEPGEGGWVTFHRRPIVLQRLRERFSDLISLDAPRVAMAAIREESNCERRFTHSSSGPCGSHRRVVSATDLYRRILAVHFAALDWNSVQNRPLDAPTLAAHQERAFERACHILDRHGGVIVADALGLGKTYVGLRLLEKSLQEGVSGLVIAPAALRGQWSRELVYLVDGAPDPGGPAAHPGQAEPANLELWFREKHSPSVQFLSSEALGRKAFDPKPYEGAELVIVDEAHNFRNPSTQRYRRLTHLLRHARVVLLTATPINNSIRDLQHLIDLFAAPGAFRYLGIADYREVFRRDDVDDADLQRIISACVLRRTRRFLRAHYGTVELTQPSGEVVKLRFPERAPAVQVPYDLEGTYGDLLSGLPAWLDDLRFPDLATSDAGGGHDPFGEGSAALLKMTLLKRLESSVRALRRTVIQQLAWCDAAVRALAAGRLLTRPDYRSSFRGHSDDPGSQLAFFELMLPAPSIEPDLLNGFAELLNRDLRTLTSLNSALAAVGPRQDRKLQELLTLLDGPLAGRKTLVFTEFRDTARYLHQHLRDRPYLAQIDSSSAYLGAERAGRDDVIARFAPLSNGLPPPPDRERVDLLIATDVLSEGLNLQDAVVVVSYDLPWNPVRLMQRVGRIDRLGAVEDSIEVYHFAPASALDQLLGLMARLRSKVSAINSTLGLEHAVLGVTEGSPQAIQQLHLLAEAPDGYEQLESRAEGPIEPEEQAYIDCVASFAQGAPNLAAQSEVSCVAAKTSDGVHAVSYWHVASGGQRRGLWLCYHDGTRCVTEDAATAIAILRESAEREVRPLPDGLLTRARHAFQRHAEAVTARLEAARIAGDALNPSLPQCRIAAWLSRYLETRAAYLEQEERASIDKFLGALSQRFALAQEKALVELLATLPSTPDKPLLSRIEQVLAGMAPNTCEPTAAEEVGILILC